mmetsp:Transcript_36924/g.91857  ORF Transcript_36924/g.91857 Transcript_36924/m.91857 type:complete len:226 (-) Transcript_36924:2336-3013(-)
MGKVLPATSGVSSVTPSGMPAKPTAVRMTYLPKGCKLVLLRGQEVVLEGCGGLELKQIGRGERTGSLTNASPDGGVNLHVGLRDIGLSAAGDDKAAGGGQHLGVLARLLVVIRVFAILGVLGVHRPLVAEMLVIVCGGEGDVGTAAASIIDSLSGDARAQADEGNLDGRLALNLHLEGGTHCDGALLLLPLIFVRVLSFCSSDLFLVVITSRYPSSPTFSFLIKT